MTIRDLFVEIGMKVDDKPLKQFDKGIQRLEGNLRILRRGLLLASAAVVAGFGFLIKKGGTLEQIEIGFEVMLGSAEKAQKLLAELFEFAKKTPFQIEGILNTSSMLIGMGFAAEDLIGILNDLGNIAAGLPNASLERLALNLGQVRSQAKLTGRELKDFAVAGVPILEELAKILGTTQAEARELVSQGKINFDLTRQAFKNLAGEGGRFFNLMPRMSETTFGIFSNILDVITLLAQDISKVLLPTVKKLQNWVLDVLEGSKKIIKLKLQKIVLELVGGLKALLKILYDIGSSIKALAEAFGGLGNVIQGVSIILLTMFGISTLSAIGNIALAVGTLAKAFLFMGNAAVLATFKASALPLLVGVALLALGLILEDIVSYFAGKRTLTRPLLKAFERDYPEAFEKTKNAIEIIKNVFESLKQFIKEAIKSIKDELSWLAPILASAFYIDVDRLESDLDRAAKAFRKFVDKLTRLPFIGDFFRILEVELNRAWKKLKLDMTPEELRQAFQVGLVAIPRMFPMGVPGNVFGLPGGGFTPALAPAHTTPAINNLGANVNQFSGDIIVNVVGGDGSPEAIGEAVGIVVEEKLGDMLQSAHKATQPQVQR